MERSSYAPGNYRLSPEAVDVSGLKPAKIIHSEIMPPSPDLARWEEYRLAAEAELHRIGQQIEHDMQREAMTRAALLDDSNYWQGIHRRKETFGEIARDEISTLLKRGLGKIAVIASQVGSAFSRKHQDYGKLEDIGFGDTYGVRDATEFYTEEELNDIYARVAAGYEGRGEGA